jgi:Ca-activated chloride channel family protein
MTFLWPAALALLLLIPVAIVLDRRLAERRHARLAAAGMGSLPVTGVAQARWARLKLRIPPAILLAGIALAIVALARPQAEVSVPRQEGVVVLAFDVSGSMAATDLQPTRMEAARAAAKAFVQRQPAGVVIGIVAFSDGGISVQTPTRDQSAVLSAIDRLQPQQGTSLGQGILAAVHTIDVALNPPPTDYYSNRSPEPTAAPTPVPAGVHAPAVVVLLSDGENNENPDPLKAAQTAADRGIRIDTVAVGSAAGVDLELDGFTVHTQLNKDLLDQIATTTGGTSNEAADSASLLKVYDTLDTKLSLKSEPIEITALVAGLSLALLVIGGLLSLRWLGRLP